MEQNTNVPFYALKDREKKIIFKRFFLIILL